MNKVICLSRIYPLFIKELDASHPTNHYYGILKIRGQVPKPNKGSFIVLSSQGKIYSVVFSYAAALELDLV